MKTDYFYWLLNMTIAGTVTGLVLLGLRQIKGIPRQVVYLLWLIPAFRFAVPVSFSARFSVMNAVMALGGRSVPVFGTEEDFFTLAVANYHHAADFVLPVTGYRESWLEQFFTAASWIWLAGVVLLLLFVMWSWRRSVREKGIPDKEGVYRSEAVEGPVVLGIFRSRIVLPVGWGGEGQEYALLHEQIHLRRKDNLFRLLAVVLACVHWFNPFAWLALRAFFEDLELSCDEAVIRSLDEAERKEYALALLGQAEKKQWLASAFGGAGLRGRLERILTYKGLSGLAWCAVAALALCVTVALAANPL